MIINPRKGKDKSGTKWRRKGTIPAESTSHNRVPHGDS
jgi:hypothetical protein